jgi:EAL domain-containing protein (putative c-di-GMP-specific phosphodiesterase class I)
MASNGTRRYTRERLPVLVVDDDPKYLRVLRRLLETNGWDVTVAEGPTLALQALSMQQYAVVLAELAMPGMDGVRFLGLVRECSPHAVRVLLTGVGDLHVAVNAVNMGNAFRYLPKPGSDHELLAALAEAAAEYRAGLSYRGRIATPYEHELRASFSDALDGLWMAYQPIVSWPTHAPLAFEALMRSRHESLAAPSALLDAAERLGELTVLGGRIRDQVADALAAEPTLSAFVNVHGLELIDDAIYDPDAPLSRHASRVVLEITERIALAEVGDIKQRVGRLRALGFRVAVDDLGAGYAGLTTLVDLEPEVVKLDMSLVRNIDSAPTKQKLVRAVSALCHELGSMVIAEGVETVAERNTLLDLGMDVFQGFLVGMPAPHVAAPAS